MNKTYIAMTMNNADLNVGTIYFTDAFLNADVVLSQFVRSLPPAR